MKDYWINPYDDYSEPEEALSDASGNVSNVERPISESIFKLIISGLVLLFIFYLINLSSLIIKSGDELKGLALQNITLNYSLPAARGVIYDRNGKQLAYSSPDYKLVLVSKLLPKTPQAVMELTEKISLLTKLSVEEIKTAIEQANSTSILFLSDSLEKSEAMVISQNNLPGVYALPIPKRIYPEGNYFSNIIGYVNKASQSDMGKDSYYTIQDRVGRVGIEESYEEILRGKHGYINFMDNIGHEALKEGSAGQSVVLHIDTDAQKYLYEAVLEILRANGLKKAAAVMQNPNNGAIIAMVSFPSYDNNIFQNSLSQKDVDYLFKNNNKPLFNRVVGGQYSPGSTIKPLYALAGLKEGVITPSTTITDTKGYISIPNQFNPDVVYIYKDWKIQGKIGLREALAQSSDIYFYSVGGGYESIKGLGIERMISYLKYFLIDKVLGVDIPGESDGFIPSPSWKQSTKGEGWYTGDTYNISIGQGDLLVTPLWLNTYIGAIANGGEMYKPKIADKFVDEEKKVTKIMEKEVIGEVQFNKDDLRAVREGMRMVVTEGTGRRLSSLPIQIAAKTGTAEVIKGKSLTSLTTMYGPYQDPEFTLTIIIEGISEDQLGVATKAAEIFIQNYLKVKNVE